MTATPESHYYSAFGLRIRSELPLPELDIVPDGPVDVNIRLRPIERRPVPTETGDSIEFGDGEQFMIWPIVGAFLITGDHTIDIDPTPGASEQYLAFPLLGPVFSVLLHLRGMLVLHASAIAVDDEQCVIFAGDKLAGKSTTAAAMIRAGHQLLTDDLVAISFDENGQARVAPACGQIKLAEDAEAAISLKGARALPLVHPGFEKRQHRLSEGFLSQSVRPSRIYLLERGTKADITRLPPVDALKAIMRFSYVTRFDTREIGADGAHLANCARLANLLQVCRLEVPTGLERIDEAIRLVESDVAR